MKKIQNRSLKAVTHYLKLLHPDEFTATLELLISIERWYVDDGQNISEGEDIWCKLNPAFIYDNQFTFNQIAYHLKNLGVFKEEPGDKQSSFTVSLSLEQLYKARLAYSLLPKKETSVSGKTFLTFEGREEISTCRFDRDKSDLVFDKGFGTEQRIHVKYSKYRYQLINRFFTLSRGRPITRNLPTDELYDELYSNSIPLPNDRNKRVVSKHNRICELARKYNYFFRKQGLKNSFFVINQDEIRINGLYTKPFFKRKRNYR